jgi:hypothetical protein
MARQGFSRRRRRFDCGRRRILRRLLSVSRDIDRTATGGRIEAIRFGERNAERMEEHFDFDERLF